MSFAVLAELIDTVEIARDRREITAALALRDRLDAGIAVAVADYEAAGRHQSDGAVTINGWLRGECGRDPKSAARIAATGRKLRALPALKSAARRGEVSGGQVDVILANVPARHLERFAEQEATLVPTLAALTVDQTRRAMELWQRRADALDDGGLRAGADNEAHLSRTLEGRVELRSSLDADNGAVVEAAFRTADQKNFDDPAAVRRAHALVQICQHFLDHQQIRTGGRHRPHLNVVITAEDLDAGIGGHYLDTDQPLSPAALGVLRCDSALHRLVWSGASGILDYGRATRTWPVDIYNAIAARDGGCRFGTCDAPPSWCDIHHVQPWEDGGDTTTANGAMACRRHHRLAHKPGHHFKLLPDGTTEFTHPDGRVETNQPRGPVSQELWKPGGS
jgi:HNH endonuclease